MKPIVRFKGWDQAPPFEPVRTLDIQCYHCLRTTTTPAPTIADAEAEMWKRNYTRLLGQLNDAIKLCHMLHGTDPMYEQFKAQMLMIRDQLGDDR